MNTDKNTLNNQYFQIVIGIIFGIILIILFINKNSFLGIFAIIGIFFILMNIIRLINVLNGEKTNFKKLIMGTILAPLIIGSFIGIVAYEFKHLEDTVNNSHIFRQFGFYGLLIAIFFIVSRYFFQSKVNRKLSFIKITFPIIVFPLLFICSVSFINRFKIESNILIEESVVNKKEFEIDKKNKNSKYWIYSVIGNQNEKIEINSEIWNKLEKNDTIILYLKNGRLDYKIIERVEKKPTANIGYEPGGKSVFG